MIYLKKQHKKSGCKSSMAWIETWSHSPNESSSRMIGAGPVGSPAQLMLIRTLHA
jgi:hypothetical protein